MNRDKVKEILDKTNIYVLDEAYIIEYIDELETKINKAIEYIEQDVEINKYSKSYLLDILKGEDNE